MRCDLEKIQIIGNLPPRMDKIAIPQSSMFLVTDASNNCGVCGSQMFYELDGSCVFCLKSKLEKERADWTPEDLPDVPNTRDKAIDFGLSWSWDREVRMCPHGPHAQARHMNTGRCVACSVDKDCPRRRKARITGAVSYVPLFGCNKCGASKRTTGNAKCWGCHPTERQRVETSMGYQTANPTKIISRREAQAQGLKVYRTGHPCKYGHTGYRRVYGSSCVDCRRGVTPVEGFDPDSRPKRADTTPRKLKPIEIFLASSNRESIPRSEAIQYGFNLYKSPQPCKYGHYAFRRVSGGACVDCQKGVEATLESTKSEKLMREYPDTYITKEAATRAGLEVYKTGDFPLCHHESGWRYVTTSECVECAKLNGTVPGLGL